ncbi:MAG: AAA family ATPase [Polyangiales bacterium]
MSTRSIEDIAVETPMRATGALKAKPANDPPASLSPFTWIGVDEIFAPLPPTKWIVEGLQICPGRPSMVAAFGGSGKTIALQSALLSCASALPVWGRFNIPQPLRVRHIDHEQGRHATLKRYQRLAVGLGIEAAQLHGRLDVAIFPGVYLNDENAEEAYVRACDGVDVVMIDALRGATPGVDENDSKIRACLDTLTRVSERTAAGFIVIHHAGKPKGDGLNDPRYVGRGSAAIFDAVGCQLVIVSEKGERKLVTQSKQPAEAEGKAIDDFTLTIEDVLDERSPTAGVRVVARETVASKAPTRSRTEEIRDRILEVVRSKQACSQTYIETEVGGRVGTVRATLRDMISEGIVVALPAGDGLPTQHRVKV